VGVLQILLFRELVTVRYAAHFDRIEQTIPLFRTTQWMWFFTSLFYTYSEFVVEVLIKSNISLHGFIDYAQLAPALSFLLYTATFVVTIATFQPGHIRFQLNQLCWTIVVLCLTVGQLKYIMHNGEILMDSLVFLCVVVFMKIDNLQLLIDFLNCIKSLQWLDLVYSAGAVGDYE
jgi:phosphatidate cytidylyltransferase